MERDLRKVGNRDRVVLRSDGEPAIKTLMREVANERGDAPTVLENSPPSESKANGVAERAVRSVEEQIRVLKIAFETNTRKELSVQHPGMAWLVEHAADTLSKCIVGKDGRTGFERARMRKYHGDMFEWGSVVHLKIPGKPKGGGNDRAMAARHLAGKTLAFRRTYSEFTQRPCSERQDGETGDRRSDVG